MCAGLRRSCVAPHVLPYGKEPLFMLRVGFWNWPEHLPFTLHSICESSAFFLTFDSIKGEHGSQLCNSVADIVFRKCAIPEAI